MKVSGQFSDDDFECRPHPTLNQMPAMCRGIDLSEHRMRVELWRAVRHRDVANQ